MDTLLIIFLIVAGTYLINFLYVLRYLYHVKQEKRNPFRARSRPNEPREIGSLLFIIRLDVSNETVRIGWEFKEGIRGRGFYLLGYKKEKHAAQFKPSFVRSYDNDQLIESIKAGCAYDYKFIIRREFVLIPPLHLLPDPGLLDRIEFSVEVETTEERIRKIKQNMELIAAEEELENARKRKVKTDPIDARITQIQEELKGHLKSELEIDSLEKEFTDEINSGPYTRAEKHQKLERLRLKILQIKNNL